MKKISIICIMTLAALTMMSCGNKNAKKTATEEPEIIEIEIVETTDACCCPADCECGCEGNCLECECECKAECAKECNKEESDLAEVEIEVEENLEA